VFGAAMGPFIGKWLRLLERHIPMVKAGGAGSTGIQLAKRVLADQVVMYVYPSPPSVCLRLIG
jgi:protein Mpv17